MLFKLAIKNIITSIKDFGIYFITITFGVAIFYMFNSIESQASIMEVTKRQQDIFQSINQVMGFISLFISVILGFLILYANGFLIKRRKKELGIYLTLGMKRTHVNFIFIVETLLAAVVALFSGIILGIGLSQVMSYFTSLLFEVNMNEYKMIFSWLAFWKSILYFGVIYAVVMFFNFFFISKQKLLNLIYGSRKNDKLNNNKKWLNIFILVLSLLILFSAYNLIMENGLININIYFYLSIALGVFGTFMFYYGLSNSFITFMQSRKSLYYRKTNMFNLRQLSSQFNKNFITMSIINLLLFLTMSILSMGLTLSSILSNDLVSSTPFDASIFLDVKDVDEYILFLDKHYGLDKIDGYADHALFYSEIKVAELIDLELLMNNEFQPTVMFMKLSDYNEILEIRNIEKEELDNTFIIISNYKEFDEPIQNAVIEGITFDFEGETFDFKNLDNSNIEVNGFKSSSFIIVIEDRFIEGKLSQTITLNINLAEGVENIDFTEFLEKSYNYEDNPIYYFKTKVDVYEDSVTTKAIFSFLGIYIGLVLIISSAAILAIQSISDIDSSMDRYKILSKIGVEIDDIKKGIFIQISLYFISPLLLALMHTYFGIKVSLDLVKTFGSIDIAEKILPSIGLILFIFMSYMMVTYYSSIKIIDEKKKGTI